MANPIENLIYTADDDEPSAQLPRGSLARAEDWPDAGPIDLGRHDLPHASSTLEWWYVNSHLTLENGRSLAVFAAFFRQLASDPAQPGPRAFTHSVAWGVSLAGEARSLSKVAVDRRAPEVGLRNLDSGAKHDDPRVERALREVLRRGKIPGPTRLFEVPAEVGEDVLLLDYDGDRFEKQADGRYALTLRDARNAVACELTFELDKPPTRHGDDGVVHGVSGELMFYYFVPRAKVSGGVSIDGRWSAVAEGSGWYDHEFGVMLPPARVERASRGETCWRWLSLQLHDGSDLSVYYITRRATGEVLDNWTVLSDPAGRARVCRDAVIDTLECWRSTRTFVEYPLRMRLRVPSLELELVVEPTFADQEVLTVISEPAFWEGTVGVSGRLRGKPAGGRGWLECKGFGHANLDAFYAAVSREVRARLAATLPLVPSAAAAARWVVRGPNGSPPSVDPELPFERLAASLIAPIREIADRGGKGWRSYAALACIDVVGGDSRRFLHWLVMPEIVHVGSLIVDDVEDASALRRGAPACHVLHGVPRAINAGTAAYFLAEPPVDQDDLPPDAKLHIYRLYFDAMRAGHAGQALDLEDVSELAARAALGGDTRALERHVLSVHRLKTAVPAGMFARAGAVLGGGSPLQVERLGAFFEAVGLAFQVVDDVLDVRGFERNLKQRGEDIAQGKVTLPVVKALGRLPPSSRAWLWRTLAPGPRDPAQIEAIARLLEDCGALQACSSLAREIVEQAWAELDPVLPESQFKLMFRAFSWYVLERHY
ncbi:MAG TPA: polyprenyl synthetase family protein [Polyangiaceae bacterium]|nr:polyprenyl synthetase family protein [Polyangiaceae bacterium]